MSFAKPYVQRNDDEGGYAALMCKAHECPNRWSVSPQMLCGAHAWVDQKKWSEVTNGELQAFARRSYTKPAQPLGQPLTMAEKMGIVQKLRDLTSPLEDGKAWAKKLKQREADGEILSPLQQKFWRGALRESL